MQPEELSREVHRLYWQSDAPVTRLAEQLGIARGTFYNHLEPLRVDADCSACGGALEFHTRSDRESGSARCADCGSEENATAAAGAARHRTLRGLPGGATHTREATLLAERADYLDTPAEQENRLRTQLVVVAVGAAVLGLGLLYYSRRRK